MRKGLIPILILCVFTACRQPGAEKPLWQNKKNTVSFPADSLVFAASGKNWEACLLSFSQPVPLKITYLPNGFILTAQTKFGITEGSALLILGNASKKYYYELQLHNSSPGTLSQTDYRSPKTVNTDSALVQHRMLHTIDEWRNLLPVQHYPGFFYEEKIKLAPAAGTYRAQEHTALSSFYVMPGSAVTVPLRAAFLKDDNIFEVTAGPLKDKFHNTVSDGTMTTFLYHDQEKSYRMEAASTGGFATVKIPAQKNSKYQLTVKLHNTISKQILLLP